MCPSYASVIPERFEGVGQLKTADIEALHLIRRFKRFLVHVRRRSWLANPAAGSARQRGLLASQCGWQVAYARLQERQRG